MNKLVKRTIAFVMMILFVIPVSHGYIFATDTVNDAKIGKTEYATLASAFTNAADGDVIKLQRDVTITKLVTAAENKNITLDLAGYELTFSDVAYIRQYSNSTLTIKDSVADMGIIHLASTPSVAPFYIANESNIKLTFENVSLSVEALPATSYIYISSCSNVDISFKDSLIAAAATFDAKKPFVKPVNEYANLAVTFDNTDINIPKANGTSNGVFIMAPNGVTGTKIVDVIVKDSDIFFQGDSRFADSCDFYATNSTLNLNASFALIRCGGIFYNTDVTLSATSNAVHFSGATNAGRPYSFMGESAVNIASCNAGTEAAGTAIKNLIQAEPSVVLTGNADIVSGATTLTARVADANGKILAGYTSLDAAASAATSGNTIALAVDYEGEIALGSGVSLDLNGHKWTATDVVFTLDTEYITDSVGTGVLVADSVELYGANAGKLPLYNATAGGYNLASYALNVTANDYEAVGNATRFWFQLEMAEADLDKIIAGDTGMTIGVELDWGGEKTLAVTISGDNGAEAFAAEWAAAYKNSDKVWLYVDVTGLDALQNDMTVTPVLYVKDQTSVWTDSLTYTVN